MQIESFGSSDIGQSREQNEDAFLLDEGLQLYVVCDGVGGHAAGEVAARKTAEFVCSYLSENRQEIQAARATPGGYFRIVELVEAATVTSCRRLHELASSEPGLAGMGTTLTMLLIVDNKGIMSHVGDSRLYLQREGRLHLLSNDHTLANEMLQRGLVDSSEFQNSPYHHVLTRSVGGAAAVETELLLFDILPNDTFLLCTDGLSNYVCDASELVPVLRRSDLASAVGELINAANERGGKDNITAVVIRAGESQSLDVGEDTRLKTGALKASFLCRDISYSRLLRLVEIAEVRRYAVGAGVLVADSPCEGLYLVAEGQVSVASRAGERAVCRGQCFGETALIRERAAAADVSASQASTIVMIPRAPFQRLTRRFPRIGRLLHARLLDQLSARLDEIDSSV